MPAQDDGGLRPGPSLLLLNLFENDRLRHLVGDRLAALRDEHMLTTDQLASSLRNGPKTPEVIARLEEGILPDDDFSVFREIACFFRIRLNEFLDPNPHAFQRGREFARVRSPETKAGHARVR